MVVEVVVLVLVVCSADSGSGSRGSGEFCSAAAASTDCELSRWGWLDGVAEVEAAAGEPIGWHSLRH